MRCSYFYNSTVGAHLAQQNSSEAKKMLAILVWFIASAAFVDLAGYWLHRLAHKPWSYIYRPHMTHHVINYPPRSFFSTSYKSAGSDSLAIWFLPFGVVYAFAVLLIGPAHPWAILLGGATIAILSSIAHDLTHISGSIVWKNSLFRGIAVRHHTHHFKMGRNFGVLFPWWDGIFGTRRAPDAPSLAESSQRRNRRRGQ